MAFLYLDQFADELDVRGPRETHKLYKNIGGRDGRWIDAKLKEPVDGRGKVGFYYTLFLFDEKFKDGEGNDRFVVDAPQPPFDSGNGPSFD